MLCENSQQELHQNANKKGYDVSFLSQGPLLTPLELYGLLLWHHSFKEPGSVFMKNLSVKSSSNTILRNVDISS